MIFTNFSINLVHTVILEIRFLIENDFLLIFSLTLESSILSPQKNFHEQNSPHIPTHFKLSDTKPVIRLQFFVLLC